MLSVAAGVSVSTIAGKYVFKNAAGEVILEANADAVDGLVSGSNGTGIGKANPDGVKIKLGQQDKHIYGTNNYNQGIANGKHPSILTENPQWLLDNFASTGNKIPNTTKERVDFGNVIGQYYDETAGGYVNTTKGIIHYDSNGGAHIVPSRP